MNIYGATQKVSNPLTESLLMMDDNTFDVGSPSKRVRHVYASQISGGSTGFTNLTCANLNVSSTASITSASIPTLVSSSGTIGTLTSTSGTIGTLINTSMTSGSLVSTNANVSFATCTTLNVTSTASTRTLNFSYGQCSSDLSAPLVVATNLTCTSASIASASIPSLTCSNGTISSLTCTSASIPSVTATSASISTGTIGTLNSSTASVHTLTGTSCSFSSGTIGTLTSTSASLGSLSASSGNITSFTSASGSFPTMTCTNATISSATMSNLTSSNASITSLQTEVINNPTGMELQYNGTKQLQLTDGNLLLCVDMLPNGSDNFNIGTQTRRFNSIFGTTLHGFGAYIQGPLTVNANEVNDYTLQESDCMVLVGSSDPHTVTLPLLSSLTNPYGKVFIIIDETGFASANNITILPSGDDLINRASSYVIDTNHGVCRLTCTADQWITW